MKTERPFLREINENRKNVLGCCEWHILTKLLTFISYQAVIVRENPGLPHAITAENLFSLLLKRTRPHD